MQPNLRSLLVAPSVVSIGREAFADCGALDKPELSENVEYIGYRAFDNTKFYNSARTQTNKNTSDGGIYLDTSTVSRRLGEGLSKEENRPFGWICVRAVFFVP